MMDSTDSGIKCGDSRRHNMKCGDSPRHHALRGGGGKISGGNAGTAANKAEEIGGGIELTESEEDMGACSPDSSDKTLESVLKSEGTYFHPGHTNYYEGGGARTKKDTRTKMVLCAKRFGDLIFLMCARVLQR